MSLTLQAGALFQGAKKAVKDMKEVGKLQRIMKRCFDQREWDWLSGQVNFMKLYEEMITLEQFEGLCELASNMLTRIEGHDRAALMLRLEQNRAQVKREVM